MSHYRKLFLYALWICPALLAGADANLILKNGRIWTGDPANPWAEALAIHGNRIVAVGDNLPVAALATPDAHVIDLGGRLAIPGFNDAHVHFLNGALSLLETDLAGACTISEMQKRFRDFAAAHPKDPWITGSGLDPSCFPDAKPPTREDLDAAVRDRPVFLRANDRRTSWSNSKALQLAGAPALVRRMIPEPTREKKLAALEQGLRLAASLGITSIQNAVGDAELVSLFDELERQHKLTLRASIAMSVSPQTPLDAIEQFIELKRNHHSPHVRVGGVNFVLDGGLQSHAAAMLEPSADASAKPLWEQEDYDRLVSLCDSGGLQIQSHAVGDRAVRMALDAYENARRVNGVHDARYRVEHLEAIAPADVARFARLGVLASMEPIRGDPERMEKAGARLVFSSDWPSNVSFDPIRGLQNPVKGLSMDTAVRAYTANGAYASFEEKIKGELKQGMLADIAVLSQDLFTIDPAKIHQTKVDITIMDGQVVFTRQ